MNRLAPLIGFTAILAGCAHYAPAPISPTEISAKRNAGSIADDAIRAELARLAPTYEWSGEWNTLTLFAAALVHSAEIKAARANLQAAAAEARAARVPPGPTLTLTAEYAFNPTEASPWLVGAASDMLLDVGGRRKSRVESADVAVRLAEFDYAASLWSVRMAIKRALIAEASARVAAPLAADLKTVRGRQLAVVARRVASGEASRADLDRVRSDAAAAAQTAAGAQAALLAARLDLAAAVGVPPGAIDWSRIDDRIGTSSELERPVTAADKRAALRLRTEILRAAAAYDQAEAGLRAAVAAQYPEVRLGPGYIWERGLSKLPFALTLTFPSSDLNKSAIEVAEARRAEAGSKLEAAVAAVDATIARAEADRQAAITALDILSRDTAPAAEALARQADRELAAGALNRGDWAASQAGLLAARLDEATAKWRVAEANAALEDALRMPLSGPETLSSPDQTPSAGGF